MCKESNLPGYQTIVDPIGRMQLLTTERFEEQWSIVGDMENAKSLWDAWDKHATATLFPIRGTMMQSLAAFWHEQHRFPTSMILVHVLDEKNYGFYAVMLQNACNEQDVAAMTNAFLNSAFQDPSRLFFMVLISRESADEYRKRKEQNMENEVQNALSVLEPSPQRPLIASRLSHDLNYYGTYDAATAGMSSMTAAMSPMTAAMSPMTAAMSPMAASPMTAAMSPMTASPMTAVTSPMTAKCRLRQH